MIHLGGVWRTFVLTEGPIDYDANTGRDRA